MEKYEAFSNYIDGTLPYEEEQKLFSEMNYDDEIRNQFRRFIAIDRTFKRTSGMYVPPNEITNKLYSGLGFSIPENINSTFIPSKTSFLKSGKFKVFISGVTSAIIAVIGTFLLINPNTEEQKNFDNKQIIGPQTHAPKIESKESEHITNHFSGKPIIKNKYIREKAIEKNKSQKFEDNKVVTDNKLVTDNLILKYSESNYRINSIHLKPNNIDIRPLSLKSVYNPEPIFIQSTGEDLGLSLEINGSANWNFPKETISPKELQKFNNTCICLFYKINDRISVGAGIRLETFFIKYRGYENDTLFGYEQQPNFLTYGLSLRYNFINFEFLSLFTQASVGLNNYGIVARPGFGIMVKPVNEVSFILGTEYSYMAFKHLNSWFDASKISFNYGVNYHFK